MPWHRKTTLGIQVSNHPSFTRVRNYTHGARANCALRGRGAERPLCGMQRGGSVLSKRVSQAAAQGDDYCEADRVQREPCGQLDGIGASPNRHPQGQAPAPIPSAIRNLNRRRKALGAGLRLVSVDSFGSFRLRRQPTGLTFPSLPPLQRTALKPRRR